MLCSSLSPPGHATMSGEFFFFFSFSTEGGSGAVVLLPPAGGDQGHCSLPYVHRTAPTTENDPAQG